MTLTTPPEDNRERHVCTHCGMVHYQNPKLVVGSIPAWDVAGQTYVLLCKRAIEPRRDFWTLPAGFMENGETTSEAASRETLEEAGARINLHEVFSILNVPHVYQVHLFYRATLLDLDYCAGTESLEVALFSERDIPWNEIAFPTVAHTLRCFFEDLKRIQESGGEYQLHTLDLFKPLSST